MDFTNIDSKVLLHYSRTAGYAQTPDLILEENVKLEIQDQNGVISLIDAKDCKGHRASLPLDFNTNCIFDDFYVRAGYALTFPLNDKKGKNIKLARTEFELRKLFNFTDLTKVSFWTHDYDNLIDFAKLNNIEKISFVRGLFSRRAIIRPGPKGYIALNYSKFNELISDEFYDIFESLIKCEIEPNGSNIFIQERSFIKDYILNVGFVQTKKIVEAKRLYRSHIRIVNDVIHLNKDNYLYYHVMNYGNPKYYNDRLAIDSNVNYVDPKNKRTPLTMAIKYPKHNSYYPSLWLLQHGANTNYKAPKKDDFSNIVRNYTYEQYDFYSEFQPLALSYILNDDDYTEEIIHTIFYKCPLDNINDVYKNAFDTGKLTMHNIIELILLTRIRGYGDRSIYETYYTLFNHVIDHTTEDLNSITKSLIDKMTNLIVENEEPYGHSRHRINGVKKITSYSYNSKNNCPNKCGYYYIYDFEVYIALLDCLLKKSEGNFNKELELLQTKMTNENIILYRDNLSIHTKLI